MDIKSIDGFGNNLIEQYSQYGKIEQEINSFKETLRSVSENSDDAKLKQACQEMEAYFVKDMFVKMRNTIVKSELVKQESSSKIYEDMLDQEYSNLISKRGDLTISDMLYQELKKK